MATWSETHDRLIAAAPATRPMGPRVVVEHYGDPGDEYRALDAAGGICDRSDRTVLRVTGSDCAAWLHNLTTNQVKSLAPGQWRYAFALNVKGRILFDVNYLVDEDAIWLDLDVRLVAGALAHLNKYIIMEDVRVEDVSDRFTRFTLLGRAAVAAMGEPPSLPRRSSESTNASDSTASASPATSGEPRGLPPWSGDSVNAPDQRVGASAAVPDWTWTKFPFEHQTLFAWRDPAWVGQALELLVPAETAPAVWSHLTHPPLVKGGLGGVAEPASTHHSSLMTHHSLTVVGWSALETRRIELGIPAPVSELNEEVLPAETGQLDRAVSFTKGCYLGQEVVERMRAHKSLARKLVGVVFEAARDSGTEGPRDQGEQPRPPAGPASNFPPLSEGGQGGVCAADAAAPTQSSVLSPQSCAGLPAPLLIDDKPVGTLTSVCHSPRLGRKIGLAYIRVAQSAPGTKVRIADHEATVSVLPIQV